VGSYISIIRLYTPQPYGEDLVLRKFWWRVKHPETKGLDPAPAKMRSFHEIFVECKAVADQIQSTIGYLHWTARKSVASRSKNSKSPVSAEERLLDKVTPKLEHTESQDKQRRH